MTDHDREQLLSRAADLLGEPLLTACEPRWVDGEDGRVWLLSSLAAMAMCVDDNDDLHVVCVEGGGAWEVVVLASDGSVRHTATATIAGRN